MNKVTSKSEKYFAVSRAVLKILEQKGPEYINHSRVSREAKVSRAWIYEYMGKDRDELIDIAADVFAAYFSKESFPKNIESAAEFLAHIKAGQEFALQAVKKEPLIIRMYFRYRGTESAIGACIEKYEKKWLQHMAAHFGGILQLDAKEAATAARLLLSMRLGFYHLAATSPLQMGEAIESEILDLIQQRYFK